MAPRKGTIRTLVQQEEIDLILDLYALGHSSDEVSEITGRASGGVRRILLSAGQSRPVGAHLRKYHPREDAFDNASNDEEAAYWVGMLLADGNVAHRENRESLIRLELKAADADHVRKFATFCGLPKEAVTACPWNKSSRVSVGSSRMANALATYGVTPRKSLTAQPQLLLQSRHFWRGVIDGDGCLSVAEFNRKKSRIRRAAIQLVGSCGTIDAFAEYVRGLRPDCRVSPRKAGNIWTWATCGSLAAAVVREVYHDCQVALPRKAAIAEEIMAFGSSGHKVLATEDSPAGKEPRARVFLECRGEIKSIAEWSRITGIAPGTIQARLRHGWTPEEAITTQLAVDRPKVLVCGQPGCDRPQRSRGLCDLHYKRQWRGRSPSA